MTVNRRILMTSRPVGEPTEANFSLVTDIIPTPGAGEILVRTQWLSLDPYMRGRMNATASFATPVGINDVMIGGGIGEVIASNNPKFARGDMVLGECGWQEYSLSDGSDFTILEAAAGSETAILSSLGMPGFTAYIGLLKLGEPQEGETVLVSAASGAVGAVVGQIAKLKGCRVVGIVGGPEKCAYITKELGFDAAVDRHSPTFADDLKAACPKGADVYFENVGGTVFDTVIPVLNPFARITLCGMAAKYNMTSLPEGPDRTTILLFNIMAKRITIKGLIIYDHMADHAKFIEDMSAWVCDGKIKVKEDITVGIENAIGAFINLMQGKNFGKPLVKFA